MKQMYQVPDAVLMNIDAERQLLAASEQSTWIGRLLPIGRSHADDKDQHADSVQTGGVQPYLWD